MPTATSSFAFICLILLPFTAEAQVHKWVDEKGRVHYSDQPPAARRSEQLAIPMDAAAFPAAQPGGCLSNRCQYERMRADRLREDEDRRREMLAGYEMQRRSAQSWNDLYATLAERDRIRNAEWDAFRYGPTPMDARLQRDRVFSGPPSYGGVIVTRPAIGNGGVRPPVHVSGGSRTTAGTGHR